MMNKKQVVFHSSFLVHRLSSILFILSILLIIL